MCFCFSAHHIYRSLKKNPHYYAHKHRGCSAVCAQPTIQYSDRFAAIRGNRNVSASPGQDGDSTRERAVDWLTDTSVSYSASDGRTDGARWSDVHTDIRTACNVSRGKSFIYAEPPVSGGDLSASSKHSWADLRRHLSLNAVENIARWAEIPVKQCVLQNCREKINCERESTRIGWSKPARSATDADGRGFRHTSWLHPSVSCWIT